MGESGYVYLLINAVLPGLVYVANASDEPEEFAQHLSASSGLPAPYLLVHSAKFHSPKDAEARLRAALSGLGDDARSVDPPFVSAPLHVVVQNLVQIAADRASDLFAFVPETSVPPAGTTLRATTSPDVQNPVHVIGDEFLSALDVAPTNPHEKEVRDLISQADRAYYGLGTALQDYSEALAYYQQAAVLNSPEAHMRLAAMYREGEGCRLDRRLALDHLKLAAALGQPEAYVEMAGMFAEDQQIVNSFKCWDRYFERVPTADFDPAFIIRLAMYVIQCVRHGYPGSDHRGIIFRYRQQLWEYFDDAEEKLLARGIDNRVYLKEARFVRSIETEINAQLNPKKRRFPFG